MKRKILISVTIAVITAAIVGPSTWFITTGGQFFSDRQRDRMARRTAEEILGSSELTIVLLSEMQANHRYVMAEMESELKERKKVLESIQKEMDDATLSKQLDQLRAESQGFFLQIFHAIGSLNNAFEDLQINEDDEGHLKDHKSKWKDFKRMVDEGFVKPASGTS